MAETALNLYATAALSHTGTEDSGNGVGLPVPTAGLANWYQYGNPPSGWTSPPVDGWADNGYLYLVYNGTNGLGRGIYRFAQNQNSGALTYDTFVAIAATGLVGTNFDRGCAQYDSSDGSVILCSSPTAGAGNTPVVGKWLCSSWPFSNVNAEWLSPLVQNYNTYTVDRPVGDLRPFLGANYLFIASSAGNNVITIDPSDGSVAGAWQYNPAQTYLYSFKILGENAAGQPVGGTFHANGGNQAVHKWNIANLNNWVSAGSLLPSLAITLNMPVYKRAAERLYAHYVWTQPMGDSEKTLLGLSGCVYWQNVREFARFSEMFLIHYDPDADTYREIPFAQDASRRSMGNYSDLRDAPSVRRFISVNSIPWFVGWTRATADQEAEDPGGNPAYHIGLILSAVGPGTVKYTVAAPASGTPKRITIEVPAAAKNYLNSEQYQKHQFRFQIAGGGWSDWRVGVQELSGLDAVVGGHAAWGAFTSGQSLEIEHRLGAGWPYAWDASVYRNPGEAGDPAVETVGTADAAPPREVVAKLWFEGPATYHTLVGVAAAVTLDPYPLSVEVEVE